MRNTFRFYKTAFNKWFIDLPDWGGSIDDLEMVQGADIMLEKLSGNSIECVLDLSDEPFEGADAIRLVKDLSDSVGGGDYFMETYQGEQFDQNIWFCAVTVQVFGSIPQTIYVNTVRC